MEDALKTVVVDVDDVLCDNNNRDYARATPIYDNIAKVNGLHQRGYRIVLHTARGMMSCNGDAQAADEKNRETLRYWLELNGVVYDEIIFGKPMGVMYIDDKCMRPDEIVLDEWHDMTGGSGASVQRMGRYVKKKLGDDLEMFQNWYSMLWRKDVSPHVFAPKVISYTYDTVMMEYVDGTCMKDIRILTKPDVEKYMRAVDAMRCVDMVGEFDMMRHVDAMRKNKGFTFLIDGIIDDMVPRLMAASRKVNHTMCHGDLTFANSVLKDDKMYLLDPRFDQKASSYLLDLAKLKLSIDGLEHVLGQGSVGVAAPARRYFRKCVGEDAHLVQLFEVMHAVRLARYNADRIDVIDTLCQRVYQDLLDMYAGGDDA